MEEVDNRPEIRTQQCNFPTGNLMIKATVIVGCVACEESLTCISKISKRRTYAIDRNSQSIAYNAIRLS
ncbi:hypothetical protein QUB63_25370 [Microcoleus sp. ARI1-B5]|uniref:hypothetical protein n=1 Tax=unclassified Microcoleus TaxID=2642155 RepID=UPI002FD497E3